MSEPGGKETCAVPECKIILSMFESTVGKCKCSKKFCTTHRHAIDHNCTFDYHALNKNNLKKTLIVVDSKTTNKVKI